MREVHCLGSSTCSPSFQHIGPETQMINQHFYVIYSVLLVYLSSNKIQTEKGQMIYVLKKRKLSYQRQRQEW